MLVPPGENGWLYRLEHPTIGSMVLFGEPVWLGWLMLPSLLWLGLLQCF